MFHSHSVPVLLLGFLLAAVAVWIAGNYVSNTTDTLSKHFKLGEALGGAVLLAIVTNLPEIAITVTAALHHDLSLAIGNILGGVALQTIVLVLLDIFGLSDRDPLTYRAASLTLVLEGVLVVVTLTLCIIGHELPASLIFARMTPAGLLITASWLAGVYLIGKARKGLPWQEEGNSPDAQKPQQDTSPKQHSIGRAIAVFSIGALVTLVAGYALEQTSDALATHFHMTGVLFGATILAAATSLPELSTGLASVKKGDYQMAFSDIFGGNAFLPVLFLLATLVSGQSVLSQAQNTDVYLTCLGILLTSVYIYGLIFRPRRQIARMGLDSLAALIIYIAGVFGLFAIARGGH